MTPPPTLSVIIPVYNGAATLGTCIESLLAQDLERERFEVIVVENGSTDNTLAVAQGYPVRVLQSARRGPAAARNLGAREASGEILTFTDADCAAAPNWLRALAAAFDDPQVLGAGGAILPQAPEGRQPNFYERFAADNAPLKNYLSGSGEFLPHLYTANAAYRRAIFLQVGGFNPGLLTGEDVDLSWRIQLQVAGRLAYAPEALVYHRHRTTKIGLGRQYRQYGFGEILLDTLYRRQPGYPRTPAFQAWRMLGQAAALPRYLTSAVLRRLRGDAPYQAAQPLLWFIIESQNLIGKLHALWVTRGMRDPEPALNLEADDFIPRYYS